MNLLNWLEIITISFIQAVLSIGTAFLWSAELYELLHVIGVGGISASMLVFTFSYEAFVR